MEIITNSPEETFEAGKKLAESAVPGAVYTLTGDLGVGKTVFTQGFGEGLGVQDYINSPTFTIVCEYHDGKMPFYHFDAYRIEDVSEMDAIGFDEYLFGDGVCLIEWANLIEEALPDHYTEITIEKDLSLGSNYRKITISDRS